MPEWIVTEATENDGGQWVLVLISTDGTCLREHPIPFTSDRDALRAAARLNKHYEGR